MLCPTTFNVVIECPSVLHPNHYVLCPTVPCYALSYPIMSCSVIQCPAMVSCCVLHCPLSCVLQASEVVSGSTVGTDRSTFSVIQVNITVQDENDNAPEFNHHTYQVTIPEDVHDRTPLSTPIIEVTDRDQVCMRRNLLGPVS